MLTPCLSLSKRVTNNLDESIVLSNVDWKIDHNLNLVIWFPVGEMCNSVNAGISKTGTLPRPPLS